MRTLQNELLKTSTRVQEKAVQIAANGGVSLIAGDEAVRAHVLSPSGKTYKTAYGAGYYRCTCTAFQDRGDLCAHVIATRLVAE